MKLVKVGFHNLPLAPLDRPWDAKKAIHRMLAAVGGVPAFEFSRGFLQFDSDLSSDPKSYQLPIADMVNGELMAVPRGILEASKLVGLQVI